MAYRSSTQRQLKQLAHLTAEYVGCAITIGGPRPGDGVMLFHYSAYDRAGGFYIDRKGGMLTGREAHWPSPGAFGVKTAATGRRPIQEA